MHQLQARIATGDDAIGCGTQHLCAECPRLRNAEESAVVARVGTVCEAIVTAQNSVELVRQIELIRSRLAAGQVELETRGAQLIEPRGEFARARIELCGAPVLQR